MAEAEAEAATDAEAQAGRPARVVEAPQTWRPGWVFLVLIVVASPVWVVQGMAAPVWVRVVAFPLIVWYVAWYAVFVVNGKRWRVTFDGEVVDIRGRFGVWRLRPEDVHAVVVPTVAHTCVLRVDRVDRWTLGRRLPWPFPWRRPVTPFVPARWFVDVVGVPASKVRPGGVRWVAARLLRRPLTPFG